MVFIELQTQPVTVVKDGSVVLSVARFRPFTDCLLPAGLMPEFRGMIVGART
jgi:hypothetical protein